MRRRRKEQIDAVIAAMKRRDQALDEFIASLQRLTTSLQQVLDKRDQENTDA